MKDAPEIKAAKAVAGKALTAWLNVPTGRNRAALLAAIDEYERVWAAGPYEEAPEDDGGSGRPDPVGSAERRVPRMKAAE